MAQKEYRHTDEMYNHLYRRGSQLAMTVGLCICVIGLIVDLVLNAKITALGYFMVITQSGMQATLYGFLAIKYKRRAEITCSILNFVSLILFIICLIIYLLKLV